MDHELKQYLESMEGRIVSTLKMHTGEACENVETKLLAEFWKWGRGNDRKMRRAEFSDATTLERKAAGSKK